MVHCRTADVDDPLGSITNEPVAAQQPKAKCNWAPLCSFSHCGAQNALLGCDTEILYVTVMGVVLTLTDFRLCPVETRLEEH